MHSTKPSQTTVDELVSCAMKRPMVFLVGSGVSTAYPSVLPSAWEMLREITLPVTAPEDCQPEELDRISNALPELYYEALIEFTSSEIKRLWNVLTFGQNSEQLQQYNLGPNSGHMALVYLAWKWRIPLITVNYDLMLELAARKMGLDPVVCHCKTPWGYRKAAEEKEVSIWKVHGSVDDIDSIRTTLYNITSLEASLLDEIRQLFENYRGCLIGYSGRDIDVFPFIADFKLPAPAFWVDPRFEEQHRVYQCPDKFIMVPATSTEFAHALAKQIPEQNLRERLSDVIAMEDNEVDVEKIKREFIKLGRQYACQIVESPLPRDSPNRLLIHGLALANISEDEKALKASIKYLDKFLQCENIEPAKACRALIIQAHSLHELSRFIDSEKCARRAFCIAVENGLREERGHALASIDTALCGQHLRRLGLCDERYLYRTKAWRILMKMIIDIIRIRHYCPHRLDEQSTASQIRARWSYLGHLSRTMAILQGAILSTLQRVCPSLIPYTCRAFLAWLRYFEKKSRRDGYAVGVAVARRHIGRLCAFEEYIPILDFYTLMSASEQALLAYDLGEIWLQRGDMNLAREEFSRCLKIAEKAGNKVMTLRALIGLHRSGEKVDVGKMVVIS